MTLGCLLIFLPPRLAWSQAGYYVYPALSIAEYYDDNVFRSTSGRVDDFVSRFGAGVQGGYVSDPLPTSGALCVRFGGVREEPSPDARHGALQDAGLTFGYLPTRFWRLGLTSGYTETQLPETLNETTGILASRTKARNYYISPTVTHYWDEFTTFSSLYSLSNSRFRGGSKTETHNLQFIVDRQVTWRDKLHLSYVFRYYSFTTNRLEENPLDRHDTISSHAALVGWTRQLSPLIWVTLSGGPRVTKSRVTPEVLATLTRELQYGSLSLTYERTQSTIVGRGGPVTTDRVIFSWERQLSNYLNLTITPGFYNNQSSTFDTQVYRLDIAALQQWTQWLAFRARYQFRYEQGAIIGAGTAGGDDRLRDMVFLELLFASPFRVY
jgi:hypothetical protein